MATYRRPHHDVESLIADLAAEDGVRRETAITRLSLVGIPALGPLVEVAGRAANARARVAALQALELIGAAHVLKPAGACLNDGDPAVALAALEIMGRLVRSDEEAQSLDQITTVALDGTRDERLRLEALQVLAELPHKIVEPIWRALADDQNPAVRRYVSDTPAVLPRLADPAALSTIRSPAMARELVSAQAASAPLTTLRRLVDQLRSEERAEADAARRADWEVARGALHQALAARGSRVALYDLRETIETAEGPLPGAFLAALSAIGDASCLDGLAAAYARAVAGRRNDQDWWRVRVRESFREIVRRKRLPAQHPAIRKIAARWPSVASDLLGRIGRTRQ
jgi:hypothetical protein